MAHTIGYDQITLAGNSTDIFKSGTPIKVYGYAIVANDTNNFQCYDSQAAVDAGTSFVFNYVTGTTVKHDFFDTPIVFPNGVFIDGTATMTITFFYEKI